MRFFARQVEATRSGRRLLLRFVFTASLAAALAGGAGALVFALFVPPPDGPGLSRWALQQGLAAAAGAAAFVVPAFAGLLRHRRRLAAGGTALARQLGARPLGPDPVDPAERRLAEVAREIAVAAGTQVPMLYLLDGESAVNACAAGRAPGDSVVVFTRGALDAMSREELQGVFAHAFAHILHGDVRPALRLCAIAGGLRDAYDLGRVLLEAPTVRSPGRLRASTPAGAAALARGAAGALLVGVGGPGLLAAYAMQAGAARQWSLRADATAIRITRVPEALGSALRKVQRPVHSPSAAGAAARRSHRASAATAVLAHAWFIAPDSRQAPLATHPPIQERVRRIAARSLLSRPSPHAGPVSDQWPLRWHVAAAAVRRPAQARELVLALLAPGRAVQLRPGGVRESIEVAPDALPSAARQALLELAAATLRLEPADLRAELLREARRLVEAEPRVTLLEFVFYLTLIDRIGEGSGVARLPPGAASRIHARRLRDWAGRRLARWRRTSAGAGEPADASAALALLIRAALDWHRSRTPRSLRSLTRAFERAGGYWGWSLWSPPGALDARELIAAMRVIALLPTLDQARAVKALAAALLGDLNTPPEIRAAQAAVLRALCFAWGVPLPPTRARPTTRESAAELEGAPTLVYLDA